jgi:hypothetical protein
MQTNLTPFEQNITNAVYLGSGLIIAWSVDNTIKQLLKEEAELATLGTPGGYHELPNMRARWAELSNYTLAEA